MSSIRAVLGVIRTLVNEYMQNLDRRGDDWVTLTSLVYHDGSVNEATRDKVVMTLYNITRENIISTYTSTKAGSMAGTDAFAIVQPPIYIDLHVMFIANFAANNYLDGLAAISHVISFFQQNPWFNQSNAPDLGPEIEKISMEMSSPDLVDLNHVMGMLGVKYLPSVFYKLRMLPFASTAMQALTYPVGGGGIAETPQGGSPQ
jgi:hypothetical protein